LKFYVRIFKSHTFSAGRISKPLPVRINLMEIVHEWAAINGPVIVVLEPSRSYLTQDRPELIEPIVPAEAPLL
jgi:hypothetical protein